MKLTTVIVLIGNTDNRLTQNEWCHFVVATRQDLSEFVWRLHFQGGSGYDEPWQNACFVGEVEVERMNDVRAALSRLAKAYRQDSIAIVVGETEFLKGGSS